MANAFQFNIGDSKIAEKIRPGLKAVRTVQSVTAKNSITAMAKDLILQYPCYASSDVETENISIVSKAIEKQLAAFQLAVWSADTAFGIDPTTANGTRDFIKRYHSNNDSPDKVSYVGNLVNNISTFTSDGAAESVTECSIVSVDNVDCSMSRENKERLWATLEASIDGSKLNDLYQPAINTIKGYSKMTKAIEGKTIAERVDATIDHGPVVQPIDRAIRNEDNKLTNVGTARMTFERDYKSSMADPTMISVNFFVRDAGNSRVQSAVIGIKTMTRVASSAAMRSNIVSALQSSNSNFKFVQWTRGEIGIIKDLLLDISQIKEDATTRDTVGKWFGAMRKRKRNHKAYKGGNATINPFTTLIITSADVAAIKEASGYDLLDSNTAQHLMDTLYLLGFVIVDQDTNIVYTMFDEFGDFAQNTLSSLKTSNKADTDYSQLKDVLKLVGRI